MGEGSHLAASADRLDVRLAVAPVLAPAPAPAAAAAPTAAAAPAAAAAAATTTTTSASDNASSTHLAGVLNRYAMDPSSRPRALF